MNHLSAEGISKSFGETKLFENITFGIAQGEKLALVGQNGAGKSTFLKILAGIVNPDEGQVEVRKGVNTGYLPQDPEPPAGITVREHIYSMDNPMMGALREYESIMADPEVDGDKMQEALQKMEDRNAWDYEAKVKEVLGKLGVGDLEKITDTLSGGQKKRVALARLLLAEPDLVLMDEPTNHLDLATIEWLEKYLSGEQMSLFMITHDRYFLDNVTNEIVELDNGCLFRYKGSYAQFLEQKAEREAQEKEEIEKAKKKYAKELAWMKQQPKARGTKAKARKQQTSKWEEKASRTVEKDQMEVNVGTVRQGKKIIEVEHISKAFDHTVINDFSYIFKKNEKIGIVGKNGSGKTTFLNILAGYLPPDSGTVTLGETIKVGYYTQTSENLNPDNRVIDEVREIAEYVKLDDKREVTVSTFLEQFLFTRKMQYTFINKLSGGERRRLQLLKVLVGMPNFLVLDEPTNDLDIGTLNVLEEFLVNFSGCLLIVSHDRYFMDRLVDHLFVFEGNGNIMDFPGNYSDYRNYLEDKQKEDQETANNKKKANSKPSKQRSDKDKSKQKLSFKEKKEKEELENTIDELEGEKKALVDKLNNGNGDYEKLQELSEQIESLTREIEQKTARWMELSELEE